METTGDRAQNRQLCIWVTMHNQQGCCGDWQAAMLVPSPGLLGHQQLHSQIKMQPLPPQELRGGRGCILSRDYRYAGTLARDTEQQKVEMWSEVLELPGDKETPTVLWEGLEIYRILTEWGGNTRGLRRSVVIWGQLKINSKTLSQENKNKNRKKQRHNFLKTF